MANREQWTPQGTEVAGIDELADQLAGANFPLSKDEVISRYGDKTFQWGNRSYRLADCLGDADVLAFNTIREITRYLTDKLQVS